SLPAAEWEKRERLRDRDIDAGHSCLYTLSELARGASRLSKDGRHIAKGHLVRMIDRGIESCGSGDRTHRTQGLLVAHRHVRRAVVQDRRAEEETRALHRAAAVENEARTFCHTLVDVASDLIAMLSPYQWADLNARLVTGSDDQLGRCLAQRVQKRGLRLAN